MSTESKKIKTTVQPDTSKIQIEIDNIEFHLTNLSEIIDKLSIKLNPIISLSEELKTLALEGPNSSQFTSMLFKFNQDLISNINNLSFIYDNLDI